MKSPPAPIVAMLCITLLMAIALLMGQNGTLLTTVVAVLAAGGGFAGGIVKRLRG